MNDEKELEYADTPRSLMLEKVIMGELLDFKEIAELMECTLDEFKRTFGCPNKDVEIILREKTDIEEKDRDDKSLILDH